MTIITTLNIIVCVDDKIFCVIRKMNYFTSRPDQARGEIRSEKQEIIKIFHPGSAMSGLEHSEEAKYCRQEIPPSSHRPSRRAQYLYMMR